MSRGVIKDITNQRFERLVVLSQTNRKINRNVVWNCQCDCGNTVEVKAGDLQSGRVKSCGCLKRDTARALKTIHGMRHTKISNVWIAMKQRCFNPNCKIYKHYGGRGITVCDEWKDDFQAFYDYVSKLPHYGEPGYTLDRINNDGNYEPGNVRWATRKTQNNNRRTSKTTKDTYTNKY